MDHLERLCGDMITEWRDRPEEFDEAWKGLADWVEKSLQDRSSTIDTDALVLIHVMRIVDDSFRIRMCEYAVSAKYDAPVRGHAHTRLICAIQAQNIRTIPHLRTDWEGLDTWGAVVGLPDLAIIAVEDMDDEMRRLMSAASRPNVLEIALYYSEFIRQSALDSDSKSGIDSTYLAAALERLDNISTNIDRLHLSDIAQVLRLAVLHDLVKTDGAVVSKYLSTDDQYLQDFNRKTVASAITQSLPLLKLLVETNLNIRYQARYEAHSAARATRVPIAYYCNAKA